MKRSSSLRLTLWPMPWISVTSVPIVGPPPPPADHFASRGVRIAALRFATATPLDPRYGGRRGSLLGGHGLSRGLDRLHDVHVAGAPADVAGDGPPNLLLGGLRISIEQRSARQHHGWGAEPALQAVFLLERAF